MVVSHLKYHLCIGIQFDNHLKGASRHNEEVSLADMLYYAAEFGVVVFMT